MKNLTSFYIFHNSKSDKLDIILHGGSHGVDSPLMQKVFAASKEKGNTVLTFNFPYLERGEEKSSGPELKEELATLQQMLDFVNYKEYSKIRLIAKSLGGIVASFYLDQLPIKERNKFSIVVLGYVTGEIKLKSFNGKITIIQGEKDKFGGINIVKEDLKDAKSDKIEFLEVTGADHSYRSPETKEPIYEGIVTDLIKNL